MKTLEKIIRTICNKANENGSVFTKEDQDVLTKNGFQMGYDKEEGTPWFEHKDGYLIYVDGDTEEVCCVQR